VKARLRIAGDGSVELDGRVDARHRGRSFRLLSSPGALLVGVADDRELPNRHAVVLAGDLSRVAFPEIVSLIVHGRLSGVLRIYGNAVTRTIVFSAGEVRGASSDRASERLGEIAVRMGMVKPEELDELALALADPRRGGRLVVERDLLTERDLWNAVQEHVTTIFQAILLETRGTFVLCDESFDETLTVPGLSAEGLLMEGVRRIDELRALRSAGDAAPTRVLAAFNDAFRDIFATAEEAGAGAALRRAAASVFDDDPAHAALRELRFSPEGELPAEQVLPMLNEHAAAEGRDPSDLLNESLSKVMLFLLFVAGAHLDAAAHQELHSRVKARVSQE
jgi:hypothetical protein